MKILLNMKKQIFNNYIRQQKNMLKGIHFDRYTASNSKRSINSENIVKKEIFDQEDSIIDHILELSQNNLELAEDYFEGSHNEEKNHVLFKRNENNSSKDSVVVDRKKLTKILSILIKTKHVLSEKFDIDTENVTDEYRFLRNLWTSQQRRSQYLDWEDRCDGLNKVIGMTKNRVKSLLRTQNLQYDQFWEKQMEGSVCMHDNPIFSKLQETLTSQSMQIDEMSQKLHESLNKNEIYSEKVAEFQRKMSSLKDKNKKGERKLFEMTKEKVNLQKKVFDMEVKITNKEREDKENQFENSMMFDLSGVQLVDENSVEEPIIKTDRCCTNSELAVVSNIEAAIRKKYRNKDQVVKKRALLQSSSNSVLNSSITTLRFERTNSKRSTAGNRSELLASSRKN